MTAGDLVASWAYFWKKGAKWKAKNRNFSKKWNSKKLMRFAMANGFLQLAYCLDYIFEKEIGRNKKSSHSGTCENTQRLSS